MRIQIRSTGRYLPRRVVTSEELEVELGLDPGFIASRNGVVTRHVVDTASGETTVQMCAWSAEDALEPPAPAVPAAMRRKLPFDETTFTVTEVIF